MDWITNTFNNREIALFIWGFLASCGVLTIKSFRKSAFKLIKFLFSNKVFFIFLIVFIYAGIASYILRELNLWEASMIKDTVYWIFGVGLALMVNITEGLKDTSYFKKAIFDSLKIAGAIEFISNLYVFGFVFELIATPFILLIGLLMVVSETDTKNEKLLKFTYGVLVTYGSIVLVFSIVSIVKDFSSFVSLAILRNFLLPIILTIFYIPFLYLTGLMMKYEMVFTRLGFFNDDQEIFKYAKRKLILNFKFNLKKLIEWDSTIGSLRTERKEDIIELINRNRRKEWKNDDF